jgi:MoaA/NifB/PqqE/SkfB family radical SAM enzyme
MDIPTLRFGARMALNRLRGRHSPFIVQLTLLNSCNYQCSYCYAEYYQRGGKRMPLDQVRLVLDEWRGSTPSA